MANKPLHVLHITSGSDPGGISRYLLDACRAMASRNVALTIAGEVGLWHSRFVQGPWNWVEIPAKGGLASLWKAGHHLASVLRTNPPGLIHVHYRKAALIGRILQRQLRPRPPLLYTLHGTDIPMGFPWRLFSDFGDFAHAPSRQARNWLISVGRMPEDRVFLIPHGIDTAVFAPRTDEDISAARARFNLSPSDLVLAYVGRLDDPKNEIWCLDALEAVLSRHRPSSGRLRLLVAGDGPNRPLMERRIASSGLQTHVHMLGEVDPLPVYYASDALLMPSAREGFGYVCGEAMSCGVPVLRTRTAGTEEMILEGATGRSCEIQHDAFVAASLTFLADRQQLRQMGQAAAQHVRQHLTVAAQHEAMFKLYCDLPTLSVEP